MLVADRYRLHMCVGRGGMGEVWQATDEVLGRSVAVKLMLGHETDPSAAERFRLEAQTAARLSHPHVVGVFDFGTWDGKLFLVMELVEGSSLAGDAGAPQVLPPERVAVVAAHAAAGLAAAHREGVVHRDIKPGNLLLDGDGTVKLADFGIARFVDDPSAALTTTGQIVGTGLYLAPERALGQPASPASDVYSLGCVLYQLLTGRPPFQGDTATALLYQHIDTPPAPPRQLGVGLPAAFEAYLLTLLAKQPEQRPPAQAIADWFASGAWRGHSLPHQPSHQQSHQQSHPTSRQTSHQTSHQRQSHGPAHHQHHRSHQQPQAPAHQHQQHQPSHRQPSHQQPHGHTPPPSHSRSAPTTPQGRPSARSSARPQNPRQARRGETGLAALSRRRPRKTAAVAGGIAFVVFLLIGMAWLAPKDSSAETPSTHPTATSAS
ncbi:serine/threonine protein kinase [Streptomyces sp. ISL-36]|uniref:serine/threonine-protein kinase n=1 Tax=Streptomyces sp. ISL-36 TaxID=2819182 RepID=UPI001BE5FE9E|nr:serine/threonine-protein kinase [Streptomyces sp. ISL-36]MBT2440681.1 serine/threonine protein kinase [Streptomyces sp. ISL-36]